MWIVTSLQHFEYTADISDTDIGFTASNKYEDRCAMSAAKTLCFF